MDFVFGLLIIYITYFLMCIIMNNGKIISPVNIFLLSFILTFGLAFLYKEELEFYIDKNTFLLCATAGLIFVSVEFLIMSICEKKFYVEVWEGINRTPIKIDKNILDIILLFNIFFLIITIISLFLSTSGADFAERMSIYKRYSVYGNGKIYFRFFISQSFKVLTAVTYVVGYVWIYNYSFFKTKFISNWEYTLSILCYLLSSFVSQGARQPAIELIMYFVIIFFILHLRDVSKKEIYKIIRKVIPIFFVIAAFYYYSMHLAGRNQTTRDLFEYVAHNYSGGLYFLNSIIDRPGTSQYWGQNSFNGIYQILVNLRILPEIAYIKVHANGRYGNTMTMFGRWYEDFGFIGVFIMVIIVSIFYSILFYGKVHRKKCRENHFEKILYGKLVLALVWAGYDDRIRPLITVGNMFVLFLLYMAYVFLIKKHIKIKI